MHALVDVVLVCLHSYVLYTYLLDLRYTVRSCLVQLAHLLIK
jgi:hypothetical protein